MKSLFKIIMILSFTIFSLLSADTNTTVNQEQNQGIDLTQRGLDISSLYLATFNHFPDEAGLKYWEDSVFDLESISESFFDQRETQLMYPSDDSTDLFVEKVYLNYLNRAIDEAGKEYWVDELDNNNMIRGHFILAVINGVQSQDIPFVKDREEVLKAFMKSGLNNTKSSEILTDLDKNGKDSAIAYITELSNEDKKIAEFANADVKIISYPKETNETTATVKLTIDEVPRRKLIDLNSTLGASVYPITLTMTTISGRTLYNYTGLSVVITRIETPVDDNSTK
ncbi:Proprotein convertase subtilisin/kexin type 7 precursor [hydrothermal vent metagenome]|uniref:Proprotein convertase subtilisin/kexin type 7 n=1 Tax=hydrothermal vent metagenome TaxID=652676 RepID=A0A1W1BIW8_9ZZZZ